MANYAENDIAHEGTMIVSGKSRRGVAVMTACMLLLFATGYSCEYEAGRSRKTVDVEQEEVSAAEEAVGSYAAVIDIADYGTIALDLDETAAPERVKIFVSLAQDGFYDGLTFHRIIDGFMIQCGDPNGGRNQWQQTNHHN